MAENENPTVAEFIELLKRENQNSTLFFGGLKFYRLKDRGANTLQVEFEQTVYPEDGKIIVIN